MSIQKMVERDYLNPTLWAFNFLDNQDIEFLVKRTSLPFISFTHETQNTGIKYVTAYEPEGEFTITFLETQDMEVYDYLKDWEKKMYDKGKRVFKNGDHTKTGVLRIEQPVNQVSLAVALSDVATYNTLKSFMFRNMVLLGIDTVEWEYTEGEGKQITARFVADSVDESERGNVVGGAAITGFI